jgi:hypothetical protein
MLAKTPEAAMMILLLIVLRAWFKRSRRCISRGDMVAAFVLCLALSPQAVPQTAVIPNEAVNALNESYRIGRKLHGQERISYLVKLTRAGARIDPDSTRGWCEELFALASRSPLDWDHVANQKNAAVPLAPINPDRAMELLAKVERPQPDPDGRFPEDVRADAAAHIFPWFWRKYGMKRLAQIQFQAKDIGDTGQYPYRAMAELIDHLLDLNTQDAKAQAESIFRGAVGYYKKPSKFLNEGDEFLDLLVVARRLGAADAYREAMELFITRVSVPAGGDAVFAVNVKTSDGVVQLHDHNQELLWRVMPLVEAFEPAWGQKLIEQRPELREAGNGVEWLSTAFIYGKHTPQEIETKQAPMFETVLLRRIANLNQTDPPAALQMAMSLRTQPAKIIGISTVLPGVMRVDPVRARNLYDQELRDLESLPNSPERLKALAAVSQSAFVMDDRATLRISSGELMDSGRALFRKDDTKSRADIRNGYEEMGQMVEFAGQHNLHWVVDAVANLHDRLLKAHLLIFEAQGMLERDQAGVNK